MPGTPPQSKYTLSSKKIPTNHSPQISIKYSHYHSASSKNKSSKSEDE
jgi:hypothetical protein